jgi:protein-arginine kinase activator protein McsA
MRVCEKHMARAVDTWVSKRDKSEIDLCEDCLRSANEVIYPQQEQIPWTEKSRKVKEK